MFAAMSRWWIAAAVPALGLLLALTLLGETFQMWHVMRSGDWWYIQALRAHDGLDGPGDMSNFNVQFQPDRILLRGECAIWAAPLAVTWWGPRDVSVGTFVEQEHLASCGSAEQAAATRWFALMRRMTGWRVMNDEVIRLRGVGCMSEQDRLAGNCQIVGLMR